MCVCACVCEQILALTDCLWHVLFCLSVCPSRLQDHHSLLLTHSITSSLNWSTDCSTHHNLQPTASHHTTIAQFHFNSILHFTEKPVKIIPNQSVKIIFLFFTDSQDIAALLAIFLLLKKIWRGLFLFQDG